MNLANRHIVYFLGIGGIGMSALARWFMHIGKKVHGYDKTPTPLTSKLMDEGAEIHFDDAVDSIPSKVLASKDETLIVYTPAIPKDHKEYLHLQQEGFEMLKRSEVLGLITQDFFSVAVAGTHGKTTTSSMIAHILKTAGRSSVSLMGGILQGYESNLILEGQTGPETIAVMEADEYDRSFLRLSPDIAVVTSADADHLDIYGQHDEMKSSFKEFISKVKPNGQLIVNEMLASWLLPDNAGIGYQTYSLNNGDVTAENMRIRDAEFVFDYASIRQNIDNISLPIPGYHNVENALAAISVSLKLGIDPQSIKSALSSFGGVKRRFEYHIKNDSLVYIDDYAHHPTEINALLDSVRDLYPDRKILAVFQPHLFTRTRDFVEGFAKSLDKAGEVILMPIYPARELPIEGVTTQIIADQMTNRNIRMVSEEDLLNVIESTNADVYLTVGAGDIDRFVLPIAKLLNERL